ncbi:shikimate dehydrogenase family protein [Sphingopyxis panaciterrulae]|uniref:Shikimate dehydrogenase (NADP(+)) n=1 Tax=Sphingopyxis panaciterrulae TaxID=462372 RepID=A0A7W9ENU6_9SPHN|nr:shikimate dehydrogenase [Sphingopyxis panaciterrulae]MBB5704789.1 shikimate dehydrogenase [Sphingopyxis panaciterrulae]
MSDDLPAALPYAEVIGDPIAQSKSPLIHDFWLDALGLVGRYARAHVKPEGLAAYIAERRADPDWRGCNITMPHKQAIMDLVDDPGDIRGTIGAMNTVVRQPDGALIGTNTDAAGFYAPLAELDLAGAPVIVVGAGGAARAVLFALARAGVGFVTMIGRSPLKAMGLLATFGLKGGTAALDAPLPPAALLVNASSLGMTGQPPLDLDLSSLPGEAIVYDLVYSPLRTGLLGAAEARGLDTVDGLDMLIGQAALAFELFFGAAPPEGRDEELRALLTA